MHFCRPIARSDFLPFFKSGLLALALSFFVMPSAMAVIEHEDDPQVLRKQALNLSLSGNDSVDNTLNLYKQAVQAASKAYGADAPYLSDLYYEMGVVALNAHMFNQAEGFFKLSAAKNPHNLMCHIKLAELGRRCNQPDLQDSEIKQAIRQNPSSPVAIAQMVAFSDSQGQLGRACREALILRQAIGGKTVAPKPPKAPTNIVIPKEKPAQATAKTVAVETPDKAGNSEGAGKSASGAPTASPISSLLLKLRKLEAPKKEEPPKIETVKEEEVTKPPQPEVHTPPRLRTKTRRQPAGTTREQELERELAKLKAAQAQTQERAKPKRVQHKFEQVADVPVSKAAAHAEKVTKGFVPPPPAIVPSFSPPMMPMAAPVYTPPMPPPQAQKPVSKPKPKHESDDQDTAKSSDKEDPDFMLQWADEGNKKKKRRP